MARAADRLQHSQLPVEKVAEEIGLSNISELSRDLRRLFGLSHAAKGTSFSLA
jgi:transcriptional regulator GlxA family with amidase domain